MSDVKACFPVIVVESALEHTKGVYIASFTSMERNACNPHKTMLYCH